MKISLLALDCLYFLGIFPDNHHSVVLEDRHLTGLHKNAQWFWQLFRIVDALHVSSPVSSLLSENFTVEELSPFGNISIDKISGPQYSTSPLALFHGESESKSNAHSESFDINSISSSNNSVLEKFEALSETTSNEFNFLLLWRLRADTWLKTLEGRKTLLLALLKCCAIILSCYSDPNFIIHYFQDKVGLVKDLIFLISTAPVGVTPSTPIVFDDVLEMRVVACNCLSALLDTKEQSSNPLSMNYPWLFLELGVQRGQYMGMIPCLLRSTIASLLKLRESISNLSSKSTSILALSDLDRNYLLWVERLIIVVYYLCNLNASLPSMLDNGLVSSMLSIVNVEEESLVAPVMWIDNMALSIMESVMTPYTGVAVTFRDNSGPEIACRRMFTMLSSAIAESAGKPLPASQISLLQQFISLVSCYMQESRGDTEDGQNLQLYRNPFLVKSFKLILENPDLVHSSVLSASTALIAEIMSRDPTPPSVVNWMLSQGIVERALRIFEKNPSIAYSDLPLAVVSLASAVSLTADGVELVQSTNTLSAIISVFTETANYLPFSKNLMSDQSGNIGASMEEIIRHYPVYLPVIMKSFMGAIDSISMKMEAIRQKCNDQAVFQLDDHLYSYNPECTALLHAGVAIVCCLEQILIRKESVTYFLQSSGLSKLLKLKNLSLGTWRQFLVSITCALEGSSTSLGYHILISSLHRCVIQLAEHDAKLLLSKIVPEISNQQLRLLQSVSSFRALFGSIGMENPFHGIIDQIPSEPLQMVPDTSDGESKFMSLAQIFADMTALDFMYEILGSTQRVKHTSKRLSAAEFNEELIKCDFPKVLELGLSQIHVPSQFEMARFRNIRRISGLSSDFIRVQPIYLLIVCAETVFVRQDFDDGSKKVGRVCRGTLLEATERKAGANGMIKFKTKHGWINMFRGSSFEDVQVTVVDLCRKSESVQLSEHSLATESCISVQSKFEVDKYANVSLRRGALFAIYCHHIAVRNSMIGTFARILQAKDGSLAVKSTQTSFDHFMQNFYPHIESALNTLLPVVPEVSSTIGGWDYLNEISEETLDSDMSLDEWVSSFVVKIPHQPLSDFDMDKVLIASRGLEFFRNLFFDAKRRTPPSEMTNAILSHMISKTSILQNLAAVTAFLFDISMETDAETESTPNLKLKERRLVALSTLDLAMEIWKQLSQLSCSIAPGKEEESGSLSDGVRSRILVLAIRTLYPSWFATTFYRLPPSIVKLTAETISLVIKSLYDLGTNSKEARATRSLLGLPGNAPRLLMRSSSVHPRTSQPSAFQVNETSVQSLMDMGFQRGVIVGAIRRFRTNEVALLVPQLLENPYGTGLDTSEETTETPSVDAPPTANAVTSEPSALQSLDNLLSTISGSTSAVAETVTSVLPTIESLPIEKPLAAKLLQVFYHSSVRFTVNLISKGCSTSDDILDMELLASNSQIDRDVFTVSLLNTSIKMFENIVWSDLSFRLMQMLWFSREVIHLLSTESWLTCSTQLYGLLHAMVVIITSKVSNLVPSHRNTASSTTELLILTLQRDSRFKDLQTLLLTNIQSYVQDGAFRDPIVTSTTKSWILPALLLLDFMNQPMLLDADALRQGIREIDNLLKANIGRAKDLQSFSASPEDLLSADLKHFVTDLTSHVRQGSDNLPLLPLQGSSLSPADSVSLANAILKILSHIASIPPSDDAKVTAGLGELCRAAMHIFVHLLGSSAVRDFCQKEKFVQILLQLQTSFEGMHPIAFSVLQRFLEDESYLRQAIKVVLKLIHDRMVKKGENPLSLKSFVEVACPLVYRDQHMFFEEFFDVFTVKAPSSAGLSICLKDQTKKLAPEDQDKLPSEKEDEEVPDGNPVKRRRTSERHSIGTKFDEISPKKRSDSNMKLTRTTMVQDVIDTIVLDIGLKWKAASLLVKGVVPEQTSGYTVSDLFLILADLVATFPAVALCIHRSKLPRAAEMSGEGKSHTVEDDSFLGFVIHEFLMGSFEPTVSSNSSKIQRIIGETIQDSSCYLLAAIMSRPGEGRMGLITMIGRIFESFESATDFTALPKLTELIVMLLNPPTKWAQRELFILPARDISTALISCDIHLKLIKLFGAIKLSDVAREKALSALSCPIEVLLKKQQMGCKDSDGAKEEVDVATKQTSIQGPSQEPTAASAGVTLSSTNVDPPSNSAIQEFHEQLLFPTDAPAMHATDDYGGSSDSDESGHEEDVLEHYSDDDDENVEEDDGEDHDEEDDEDGDDHHHHLQLGEQLVPTAEHFSRDGSIDDDESHSSHSSNSSHEDDEDDDHHHHHHNNEDSFVMEEDEHDIDDQSGESDIEEDMADDEEHGEVDPQDDHEGMGSDEEEQDDEDNFDETGPAEDSFINTIAAENSRANTMDPSYISASGGFVMDDDMGTYGGEGRDGDADDDREDVFQPSMGHDNDDNDEIDAMQLLRGGEAMFGSGIATRRGDRRSIPTFRGGSRRLMALANEGGGDNAAAFHIRLGHDHNISFGRMEVGERISMSDFNDIVNGFMPNGSHLNVFPNASNGTFEIGFERMNAQQVPPAAQLPAHPLLSLTDSRRSRSMTTSSGPFGYLLSQSMASRENHVHYQFESQNSSARAQTSLKRRALGPLVSDRRWGTDIGDLELPSSRLSQLQVAVERYVRQKVYGVHSSSRATIIDDLSRRRLQVGNALRIEDDPWRRRWRSGAEESKDEGILQETKDDLEDFAFPFDLPPSRWRHGESKEEGDILIESKDDDNFLGAARFRHLISGGRNRLVAQPLAGAQEPLQVTASTDSAGVASSTQSAPTASNEVGNGGGDGDIVEEGDDDDDHEDEDEGEGEGDDMEEDLNAEDEGDEDMEGDEDNFVLEDEDQDDNGEEDGDMALNEGDAAVEMDFDVEDNLHENAIFLSSLPVDLRREVLLAAEEEFLATLPERVQNEARTLRQEQALELQMIDYEAQTAVPAPTPEQNRLAASLATAVFGSADAVPVPPGNAVAPAPRSPPAAEAPAPPEAPSLSQPSHVRSRSITEPAQFFNENNSAPALGDPLSLPFSVISSRFGSRRSHTNLPSDSSAIDSSAWYFPYHGNVVDAQVAFDASFVAKVIEWIVKSRQEKGNSTRFKLLSTLCNYDLCRRDILHGLIAALYHNSTDLCNILRNFQNRKNGVQSSSSSNDEHSHAVDWAMIERSLSDIGREDTYRKVLTAIMQTFKRVHYLVWFELLEPQQRSSETSFEEEKTLFKLLLRCLNLSTLSSMDLDRSLQFIERVCKPLSKLTSEQANQLVATMKKEATTETSISNSSEGAMEASDSAEVPNSTAPEVRSFVTQSTSHLQSSSSAADTTTAASDIALAATAASAAANKKKRIPFPVLGKADTLALIDAYTRNDCIGTSRKTFHKIFRCLSLFDGNWRLFLEGLADCMADLITVTSMEFTGLEEVLENARQNREDVLTVMSRPEFNTPKVLQESKLLSVLKLMTVLRSRSGSSAQSESEVIAEYLREIPCQELWDQLCACLEKVREIETFQHDRDARRKSRARTLSFSTSSSAANLEATASESNGTGSSSNNGSTSNKQNQNKPLSELTMRFLPLIEFFLSTFSRTLCVAPPSVSTAAAAAASTPSAAALASSSAQPAVLGLTPSRQTPSGQGHDLVRMSSSILPGHRFRQTAAYLATQLEISEDSSAAKLIAFAENHQELLNKVLRSNIHLLESTFSPLVNVAKLRALLHFDIKRAFFKAKLKRLRHSSTRAYSGSLKITVRRQSVFEESFQCLRYKTADEMRRRLVVSFHNEEGVDAGGLTREWYAVLAREIFNANYALFLSPGDGVTFQPNPHSFVNPDHLSYFKFVGRIIGKAICDGHLLDAHFTRSFYKHILGLSVTLQDLEAIEPDYYKSLQQLLDTPLDLLGLDLTFSAETSEFGKITIVDLIPQGRDVPVTDDTKHEYVRLLAYHRMTTAIRKQIDAFLDGFHELVPAELISIFDAQELELLISGLPDIDLDDLRAHCDYAGGYKASDPVIAMFWSALRTFSKEEKALFLQFVTGTSKVSTHTVISVDCHGILLHQSFGLLFVFTRILLHANVVSVFHSFSLVVVSFL